MKTPPDSTPRTYIPYAKSPKKPVTIRIDEATLAYFKKMGADSALPYQMLINLYLRDCRFERRMLSMKWKLGPVFPTAPSRGPVRCHACRRPLPR